MENKNTMPELVHNEQLVHNGQGSKAWFLKRHKRWTASVISKLMSEGAKVPKNAGGDGEMKWKWGDAAKTQLFAKFYQRLTDVLEKEIHTTFEMQRGIDLEPLSIGRFAELYPSFELINSEDVVETGLVLFPDNDGTREWEKGYKGENSSAGASPDQLVFDGPELHAVIETKARGEEATHSHAYAPFEIKHKDFWQVQCQMHACGVKKAYYLSYDDEKPSPWDLQVKEVAISPMHVEKMRQKIKDADELIEGYINKCEGINAMLPHDANRILTGIRDEIQSLNDKW